MIRLFFILLLALAPVQAFAEEDVSAPPASLKAPQGADEAEAKETAQTVAADKEPAETPASGETASDEKPAAEAPVTEAKETAPAAEEKPEEKQETATEEAVEEKAASEEEGKAESPVEAEETQATQEEAPAAEPVAPPAPRQWTMLPGESTIGFSGVQMGKDFSGFIKSFTANIVFDDANLEQSKVTVDIDLLSLDAQDEERNKTVKGDEWLNVEKFPAARFETKSIAKAEDGYVADATLTIHGVSQDVKLPFTLSFSKVEKGADKGKDRAVMTGKVVLDRSNFQLGQGEWEDPSIIANEISVEVKVAAVATGKALPATP